MSVETGVPLEASARKKEFLVLKDSFTTHQKIHLFGLSSPIPVLLVELLEINLNWIGYVVFLFFLSIFLVVMIFTFSRKGFLKREGKLYKAKFFRGRVLTRKVMNLQEKPVVSILKFRRSRKYAFFSAAKPDLAAEFNSFEVYVLNESHIKRDLLLRLTNEEKAKEAIDFLISNFPLRHEIYSPNFNRTNFPMRR